MFEPEKRKMIILNGGPRDKVVTDITPDTKRLAITDVTKSVPYKDEHGEDRMGIGQAVYESSGEFSGNFERFDFRP